MKKRWELKFENTDRGIKTEIWRNGAAKQKIKMPVFKNDIEEARQEHEYNHSWVLQVRWKQENIDEKKRQENQINKVEIDNDE